jgi:CRP/FNR family transcriptional regulator, cyclic AMP receptor protein
MHDEHVGQLLQGLSFFAPLQEPLRARLAGLARIEDFLGDSVIFREGTESRTLYVIILGHVTLEMYVPGRGRVRILTLGHGDMLGWSAMLGNNVMTATAVATGPTRMIAFSSHDLRELCETDHEVGYQLMRQMSVALSKRLLATRLHLLDLFANPTPDVFDPQPPGRAHGDNS